VSRKIKSWLSEIITKTTFRCDDWIHQPTQPLLTHKQSRKTELLPTQKSSPKLFQELTHGFISAHSPCWLRKKQGKRSHYPLKNSPRNFFHRWQIDSSAHTAPVDIERIKENWIVAHSEIISETFLELTHGFVSQHSPCWLINSEGKLSCCPLRNHHRNYFKSWPMDLSVPTAPIDSERDKENWVATNS